MYTIKPTPISAANKVIILECVMCWRGHWIFTFPHSNLVHLLSIYGVKGWRWVALYLAVNWRYMFDESLVSRPKLSCCCCTETVLGSLGADISPIGWEPVIASPVICFPWMISLHTYAIVKLYGAVMPVKLFLLVMWLWECPIGRVDHVPQRSSPRLHTGKIFGPICVQEPKAERVR